ncbi:hypothetical protein B0I72DRAFT_94673 [Yarrowia lipolytica]|uniref:YALI0E11330p n=2 Tax=Yarrowia lipolytica TaxID=4952 RepID=B5FVH5_YARLI|nr:YALI0E11330p [Yarrowia lipolytica CLIB122]KAB8283833.1 hypothetical protein BKA91DRAFT_136214 [Yarrowia lipolytica]KAE8172758.1 hypothetical protein BKA90DRAFT_136852 [Yarrowia lipolytica]RDW27437.1 hypothetical protein B0I71DRAFT_129000 [Yarrowia lipolytica]RDW33796.1 hypothetical protein B0I72DRAFT_94673 [Yarrowia lipolytica]RDW39005.1 hypothetical protein B0I73DRAFT_132716 [Yarrowia lipolytica]|eukprot:XP_002143069.1 YALI0E11330p [Yarrowia lipolytica CLIB122]
MTRMTKWDPENDNIVKSFVKEHGREWSISEMADELKSQLPGFDNSSIQRRILQWLQNPRGPSDLL